MKLKYLTTYPGSGRTLADGVYNYTISYSDSIITMSKARVGIKVFSRHCHATIHWDTNQHITIRHFLRQNLPLWILVRL